MTDDTILGLAIARLGFLKCREKRVVSDVVLSSEFFSSLGLGDLEQIVGRRVRTGDFSPQRLLAQAQTDASLISALGAHAYFVGEYGYPPQLQEIYDPPFVLFVRGSLPSFETPHLAIVGTRAPTRNGVKAAFSLAAQCAEAQLPVVSGLAFGIDSAAHQGAVSRRGPTVAVLGSGIDTIYPRAHRSLAAGMLRHGGAIVSEYPPLVEPRKYHFPARNRIISGLSRAVVIVEAPERSGALITADFALDQGRDLYVHGVGSSSPKGGGGRGLLADGAIEVNGLSDIYRDWDLQPKETEASSRMPGDAARESLEPRGPGASVARALQRELDL